MADRYKSTDRRGAHPHSDKLLQLEDLLKIDEHALEEVAREHPTVFYRVARELALALSRRDAAKQAVEQTEADVALRHRSDARAGDHKITADEVKERTKTDPAYLDAVQEYGRRSAEYQEWLALKEAFEQRSYAISKLVDLYLAHYYGNVERRDGDMRTRAANEARETMSRERQRHGIDYGRR